MIKPTDKVIDTDVAIIGGGLMGTSAALELRRQQRSVVVLEQGWCGAQASGVNYGGVRRQGRAACQLPLSQRAHAIWRRLEQTIGSDGEYIASGHLKLARGDADMQELIAYREMAAAYGLELELLESGDLRRRYPWIGDKAYGASLCAEDGHANPRLIAAAFARAAEQAGARLLQQSAVLECSFDGNYFVLINSRGERVRSRFLLNCSGAWGKEIAERFGETVAEQAVYPNMCVTEPLPPLMNLSLGVVGGAFYARQVERGNVVLGGGRGIGNLALDATRPRASSSFKALAALTEMVPALRHALVIRTWSGVEGETPDHQPVIGASATTPGLLHAFGFSGAGFQLAPAVGEVLAELVTKGESSTPIDAFSIKRFAVPEPSKEEAKV
jgi:sarcosine oxidase subunit beta